VEPIQLTVEFERKFDIDGDTFPHPHRKADFAPDDWKMIMAKASVTNFPGHFLTPVNSTIVLALSVGLETFVQNPIVRMYRSYLDQIEGEVVRPDGRGKLVVNENDTMSGIRWLVMQNCALIYHDFVVLKGITSLDAVIREVFRFLFKDPFQSTKTLKKNTNLLLKSAWSMATGGVNCRWVYDDLRTETTLSHYNEEVITPDLTDRSYYSYIREFLDEEVQGE
jgi:hypothetical protein